MNVIYDIADIRLSEIHTQRVVVPHWEIPVLQVIHGNNLTVVGQKIVARAVPDPGAEFKRLADRYGPKNEDVPAVAAIYGNFGPGTTKLRAEIRDSLTSADATPDDYKSPDERKLIAEQTASDSGQTIAAEAKAMEDAAAAVVATADNTQAPTGEAAQPAPVTALESIDEDIASLIA